MQMNCAERVALAWIKMENEIAVFSRFENDLYTYAAS